MEHIIGISKFKNINNVTCYMNSILVILQQSPLFCDYMVSGKFKTLLDKNKYNQDNFNDLISYQIHKLFKVSLTLENAIITPSSLRYVCTKKDFSWGEQTQQDSCEFIQFLISNIEEEIGMKVEILTGLNINKKYKLYSVDVSIDSIISTFDYYNFIKKEFSPIKTLFTGLEETKTYCSVCGNKKNNNQTFSILQLPIPVEDSIETIDIYKCLDKWSEKETLDNMNRMTCDFCGVKSNIIRQNYIYKTPKILIIQLKRFKRDMCGMVSSKINNKVNYPVLDLDISNYISNSSPSKINSINSRYNLFGINIHLDFENIECGHYISIVKNRFDNNWYLFNDEKDPIQINKEHQIINKKAYMLFYYRID